MRSDRLAAAALRLLPPETAHHLAMKMLRQAPRRVRRESHGRLSVNLLGLSFTNPIGLAAGFDKNAEAVDALLYLGFGAIEVGTVTPKPQPGNPKPRLFRLVADRAIINRMGFNSDGHEAVARRLEERRGRGGLVGVNIGANRGSEDPIGDYVSGIRRFADLASWLTINISSPNTPGLRDLQSAGNLGRLLGRCMEARESVNIGRRLPLLIKIAPDLTEKELAVLVETVVSMGANGLVIANTTVARPRLRAAEIAREQGGLSGLPLLEPSTAMLARARQLAGPNLPIIGVGGVHDAHSAWMKIVAGADLVQLYSGLIFEGPRLAAEIKTGLVKELEKRNFRSLAEARGIETARWAGSWAPAPEKKAEPEKAAEAAG
ncbi:quinone-dependent dihydroorotate dehydrogenase [Afifella sp. IM 167]|uniref:quinone-dependent dihydroorotate dehydrogenase n=1 Tax=Afifella sp. IM 167 TaxID=2033586 RepID=UPI001CCB9C1D|nr:quinone-dependent dihydroorotate dehydrogenase [Afifella sp. IM 167]MBZ8133897.1 dihydroorotate dehydrogenase (quinone) [Afifella sp. IM 167]